MKFFLLIPVFAIFLSNIPFKMEMPMPVADAKESCDMKKQEEMRCRESESAKKESCCKKESTCICFIGFQVLAPAQNISRFDFQMMTEKPLNGLYMQLNWTNPFIEGPLQPPDVV